MSQANEDRTTLRARKFAPTFDFKERAALETFGFYFESTEGHEAAELKGRCQITVILGGRRSGAAVKREAEEDWGAARRAR